MSKQSEPIEIKIEKFPNDDWTRVEIFLRAYDRLPNQKGDKITQKTLDIFCKRFERGEIKSKTVNLQQVYYAIHFGKVKIYD